jgi:hypothetical protein
MMLRWWALCKMLVQHMSLTKMTRLIPKSGPQCADDPLLLAGKPENPCCQAGKRQSLCR